MPIADGRPPLMPVAEARQRIIADLPLMPSEDIGLLDGLGRVLAGDLIARRTQPPMAMSAMDGYAVRSADTTQLPVTLTRVGKAPAGGHYPGILGAGQAVRIFTGGPVPEGADAVIIQEDVDASSEADGADIVIKQPGQKGQYIRPAGLDFSAGSVGLPAGRRLTARDIGLAAAMDHPWLTVRRKPRIAILASGDEIVRPGEPIGANQIVSSNSFALAATITAMGGEPVVIGIAPDDSDGLRSAADAARGCDMLVTTGGASVGQHDLIQTALSDHADDQYRLQVGFWRIAMRPGKPLIFGRLGQMPMLGLPGNPVSTLVCAQIFLRPAIERMLGIAASDDDYDLAILGRALPANDQREDYLRCQLQRDEHGNLVAWPFERQDSSMLSLMSSADCLLVRQPFDQARALGDSVQILHFGHTAWRF